MEEFTFYRDNVAKLYHHFDDYKCRAKYFMSPIPFEVKYELSLSKKAAPFQVIRPVKSPICLGALFLCWQEYPELFEVSSEGRIGMIFEFNGSPLSGANSWTAVNLESGEIFSGKNAPRFMERCQCLNEAVLQSEEHLEEGKKAQGITEFTPATLQEVVEFIDSLEK